MVYNTFLKSILKTHNKNVVKYFYCQRLETSVIQIWHN